jgi:Xaa-Pro aminopeptidase
MRLISLSLALCLVGAAASGEYHSRREALRKALPGGVIVLFGGVEPTGAVSRFFQEPNFYYLSGWNQPGARLLIDPEREVLFLQQHDPEREKWTGLQPAPSDENIRELTGFDHVFGTERFEAELKSSLDKWEKVYSLGAEATGRLRGFAPLRELQSAETALTRLRMEKSPEELGKLHAAIEATLAAHREAWRVAAPGKFEYEVAAAMQSVYFSRGCERDAYSPIVGSGPNSVYLHYDHNDRRMDRGEVLLMDVGAECAGYAADVTRTIPVSGKFTPRQRDIYDVVLGAQKAAIAAVRPGATLGRSAPNSIYQAALDYMNSHGKDLHGQPLGKYFTHGIGHSVGLEVHDVYETGAPLEEGMVITVEPGLYLPEENIGIRIEDMVLVTKDGAQMLTSALPREAVEIEKALAK